MARYLRYVFPAANTSDVCALQTTVGAGNLVLNGNLSNQINSEVSFVSHGYSRSISLTSAGDTSGTELTITGVQNGVVIQDIIANGPNSDTIHRPDTIYDRIISISVNGALAAPISIGTSHTGFFPLININLERDNIDYILTTSKLTAVSIHTTIFSTVLDIKNNGATFLDAIANNFNLLPIKADEADDQYIFPVPPSGVAPYFQPSPPYNSLLIYISGQLAEIANSIDMNFRQI
ncbi:MAG: hypothetical protein RL662_1776 [Bacteroidota bacterium]|jgi:hypothetical protein